MKRFTKALSMLLAIVMVVGLLPLSIIADDIQTTHTVQFKLNYNGAHKIPSQKVADGECAVQPEDVTREGWIFEYWYVKTGDGIQKFDLSQPITEDVTLYARWDEDITYWGPIWNRNILNGIAESEKEEEPETPDEEEPDDDTNEDDNSSEENYEERLEEISTLRDLNGGTLPTMIMDTEDNIPSAIMGKYSDTVVVDFESAIASLDDINAIMNISDPEAEFVNDITNQIYDNNHYRVQQVYNNVPVFGKQLVITTDENGVITSLSGNYDVIPDINTTPVSSLPNITMIIENELGYDITVSPSLIIYAEEGYNELAWLYEDEFYTIIISDEYCDVLTKFSNLLTDSATGTMENGRNVTIPVTVVADGNNKTYLLQDQLRGITLYDFRDNNSVNSNIYSSTVAERRLLPTHSNNTNNWTAAAERRGISLYYYTIQTFDYYLNELGMYSYGNTGEPITLYVNATESAGQNPNAMLTFEDHAIVYGTTTMELHTVAHEFTHGVEQLTSGLTYSKQSGAIMEAYSDIMGELVELYVNGSTDWVHGSRDLNNPASFTYQLSGMWSSKPYPSTFKGDGYYTGSKDNGGVHINNTVISHVVREIYHDAQGISDAKVLAEILYRALGYLNTNCTFQDYLNAVLLATTAVGVSGTQYNVIIEKFQDANVSFDEIEDNWWFGRHEVYGKVIDEKTSNPIAGASILLINMGSGDLYSTITDEEGWFNYYVPNGSYSITASGINYNRQEIWTTVNGATKFAGTFRLVADNDYDDTGIVAGKIIDATKGDSSGEKGLTVKLRKGYDNTTGRYHAGTISGNNGYYEFGNLEPGYYTAEVSGTNADGVSYITTYKTLFAAGKDLNGNFPQETLTQNIAVSPVISDDEFRIVLTWGSMPYDLDSHLVGPTADGDKFHVYYGNDVYGSEVDLDIDDTDSYGPETITIHNFNEGIYTYAIHDYSNQGSSYSTAMANSGAQVKVYRGAELLKTYNVPANMDGTLWTVFTYNPATKQITTVNTMSYDSSSGGSLMSAAEPMMLMSARPTAAEPANEAEEYDYEEVVMIITEDIFSSVKD